MVRSLRGGSWPTDDGVRAGSRGFVYHVGVAGDRLIERPVRRSGRLRYEPSARFLAHRLAVADAHVALIEADREARIDLADSAVEPATWRTFTGLGAARRTLKPDLYAETATADATLAGILSGAGSSKTSLVELPGIEPATKIPLSWGNTELEYAKRREST